MDTEDQQRLVLVNLHHGRKEEALIKAIIPATGGKKFQVASESIKRRSLKIGRL